MPLGSRLGIELGRRHIRAVRLGGVGRRRLETMEVELHQEPLAHAVQALKERVGMAPGLAVAVDTESLFVKRVKLPPLPVHDRRRVLALEPERFFPVRGEELVVSVREEDDLVFAGRLDEMNEWISALESLGPVERIEPAPVSLARACAKIGLSPAIIIKAAPGDRSATVMDVAGGRLLTVRKVFGTAADAGRILVSRDPRPAVLYVTPWSDDAAGAVADLLPGTEVKPLPSPPGLTASYSGAYGAALAVGVHDGSVLMPEGLSRRVIARQRKRVAVAAAAVIAAFAFALGSLDHYRSRTARQLADEISTYSDRASAVLELQAEAFALDRGAASLADIAAQRPNPLLVLQTITRLLPADASVRAVRYQGNEWQIDGYARDAARLIPVFEQSLEFEGVRFRTATSRIQLSDGMYDNFSLALRYVPSS
jgi:hypothetical protein